jgi:hypothetical protein
MGLFRKKEKDLGYLDLTQLQDKRWAYNWKHPKGGNMGVFIHGKPSKAKQKAIRSHFADFKASSSAKNLQSTYKRFPKLTTIVSSEKAPVPYTAYKVRLKNKKSGNVRDVITVTSELSASWKK